MIKINIIKNNQVTNSATFSTEQEASLWLNGQKVLNSFGKNAGEYNLLELSESELLTEISRNEIVNLEGVVSDVLVTIPDQYVVEMIDVTDLHNAQKESEQALKLLADTDWMVVRKMETGVDYPEEIKQARIAARLKVIK
jgi:hypothetical protein